MRKPAGLLLFANSLSFQQSRSPAANARCTDFAIYRTDAAPVWRDHYVTFDTARELRGPLRIQIVRVGADTVLVRILNVKVMANSHVKKVSGDGGARGY